MKALRITIIIIILAIQVSACGNSSLTGLSELENKTWVLTSLNNNPPMAGAQLSIQFEDGQISGRAGCNSYGGSYQIKGDEISFDGIYNTEMACMEPEGIMEQERAYLELLSSATRFALAEGLLTVFAGANPILIFETQQDNPEMPTHTPVPSTAIPTHTPVPSTSIPTMVAATLEVLEPTQSPTFEPPAGSKEYRDSVAGISIYIPEKWNVTGVIDGQYAIFQSYSEDKYVGGEARQAGDTKCDLNIRPPGTSAGELIQQWESNPQTTIVSDEEIILKSGLIGRRLVLESMGRSIALVAEINHRAVVLTCFGNSEPFEDIAKTLSGFEVVTSSPIYGSVEGFKHYQDTETGVSLDMPGRWIASRIVPGQRVTIQSYPENKYSGGEALEPGDTRCELFIRNDISADDFVSQMKSNETITILSEEQIILNSGQTGTRIEINNQDHSILVITEIAERTVVLTCFGDLTLTDAIANTLKASE